MAMSSNHPEQTRRAPRRSLAGEIVLAALVALQQWQSRAAQRRLLARMSDYGLKDLGLSRADVEGETAKSFWQP